MFRRVLVAWDCSPGAAAALRAAAAVVDGVAGHVVVLAVIQPLGHVESAEEGAAEMNRRRQQVHDSFAKAVDETPGATRAGASLHIVEAHDVARAVCEYARAHDFDLVVLGRHGTGGAFHPRLGHIAQAVAKHTEVPLLLMGRPR
jgi:nucleotide-binding universal stress UspA family protein